MKAVYILIPASAIVLAIVFVAISSNKGSDGKKNTKDYSYCAEVQKQGGDPNSSVSEAKPPPQNSQFTDRLPNLEYIPVYPNSTEYKEGLIASEVLPRFVYIAPAGSAQVLDFYQNAFQENNWTAVGTPLPSVMPDGKIGVTAWYSWSTKENNLPWHISLEINVDGSLPDATWVNLTYSLYPDVGTNLPTYHSVSNVTLTCTDEHLPETAKFDTVYKATITKTYFSDGSAEDISNFYATKLPLYGWSGGAMGSFEGLSFYPWPYFSLVPSLSVTTEPANDGQTKVQLYVTIEGQIISGSD